MSEAVKSAQRVMQIIDALTYTGPLTFAQLSTELGLPRSSLHGLLSTMVAGGFLVYEEGTRRYHLGIRIWEAGQAYTRNLDLVQAAMPLLREIVDELNETAQLAVLDGTDNVYLAKVESNQKLVLVSHVGSRLPAYTTGLGKALLAGLTDDEVREIFKGTQMSAYTDRTITDLDTLIGVLGTIRRRGYATDEGEYTSGVFCVAAPVRDAVGKTIAAISVSVPTVRVNATTRRSMIRAVGNATSRLSTVLGFVSQPA